MKHALVSSAALLASASFGNACGLGERVDLQTRVNSGAAIVSIFVLGDVEGPSQDDWYTVPVRVNQVLRGDPLPNDRPTEAILSFRHIAQRNMPFEAQGRYIVGLWSTYDLSAAPDARRAYEGTLGVYGGGGFCMGPMIYAPNSPLGRAITLVLDGEGDQDAELEILDTFLMGLN